MDEASDQLGFVKTEIQADSSFMVEIEGYGTVCVRNDSIYELTREDGSKVHVAGIVSPEDGCISFFSLPEELLARELGLITDVQPIDPSSTFVNVSLTENSNQFVLEEDGEAVAMPPDDIVPRKNNFEFVEHFGGISNLAEFERNIQAYNFADPLDAVSIVNLKDESGSVIKHLVANDDLDSQKVETLSVALSNAQDLNTDLNGFNPQLIETRSLVDTVKLEKDFQEDENILIQGSEILESEISKEVTSSIISKRGRPRKEKDVDPPLRKGPFKCSVCGIQLQTWPQLKTHKKIHVEEIKPHVCQICFLSFNVYKNLELHLQLHNVGNLTCGECKKTFTRFASFKSHLHLHEEEENVFCSECGDEFVHSEQLEQHMEFHKTEWQNSLNKTQSNKMFFCKTCSRMFANPFSYETHKKEHQKLKSQLIALAPRRKKKRFHTSKGVKYNNECDVCKKSFPKPSQLIRHKRIHTGEKPFQCQLCSTSFSQKGSLQIHMSKHNGYKPHRCSLCSLRFSQRGNLIAHVNKVHIVPKDKEEVFECMQCPCVFKKLASLNCHITRFHVKLKNSKSPSKANSESVQINNDTTVNVESLLNQMEELRNSLPPQTDTDILQQAIKNSGLVVKNGEKSIQIKSEDLLKTNLLDSDVYIVTIADKSEGGNVKYYTVKQRREGNVRWHLCNTCSKEFKKPSDLIRHIRTHTREKPFKCNLCFRTFSMKSTLKSHIRTHTNTRLHECQVCGRKVSSSGSLKIHYRSHAGVKPFKCTSCNKNFVTSGQFKSHCRTNSHKNRGEKPALSTEQDMDLFFEEPIILLVDGGFKQQLSRKERLFYQSQNASSSERPYECEFCHLKFRKSSHLKQHKLQHTGQKPFSCSICQKKFITNGVLKMHLKTHLGEKDFCCDQCPSKFSTKGSLKRHYQTLHCDDRPYLCPYCSKKFKTLVTCRKHIRIHRYDCSCPSDLDLNKIDESFLEAGKSDKDDLLSTIKVGDDIVGSTFDHITAQNVVPLPQTLLADSRGTITLPTLSQETLTQESIREIEQTLNQQLFGNSSEITENAHLILNENFTKEAVDGDFQTIASKPMILNVDQVSQPALDQAVFLQADELQTVTNMAEILPETNQIISVSDDNVITKDDELEVCNEHGKHADEEKDGEEMHNCGICIKRTHRKNGELPKPEEFRCDDCDKSFSSPQVLKAHKKIHSGKKEFKCELCGWVTVTKASLRRHSNVHSEERTFSCTLCPAKFRLDMHLRRHLKLHSLPKDNTKNDVSSRRRSKGPFKEFSEAENEILAAQDVKHGASVSEKVLIASAAEKLRINEKVYPEIYFEKTNEKVDSTHKTSLGNDCKYCNKSFKKPSDLVRHIRIHTGERPYQCTYCQKCFTVKSTLSSHIRTHMKVKPVSCHICESLFSAKSSLKVHMRLHTGAKPFECSICGMKFRTSGHRKNHMFSHYKNNMNNTLGTWKRQQLKMLNKIAVALKGQNETTQEEEEAEKANVEPSESDQILQLQDVTMQNIPVTEEFLHQWQEQPNIVFTNGQILGTDENGVEQIYTSGNSNQTEVRYGIVSLDGQLINSIQDLSEIVLVEGETYESSDKVVAISKPVTSKKSNDISENGCVGDENLLPPKPDNSEGHVCNYCGNTFSKKSQIERHLRIHTGERPFSCDICGKRFTQSNALEAHLKAHRGERAFSCPYCEFTCVQKGNLRTHINRTHQFVEESAKQDVVNGKLIEVKRTRIIKRASDKSCDVADDIINRQDKRIGIINRNNASVFKNTDLDVVMRDLFAT